MFFQAQINMHMPIFLIILQKSVRREKSCDFAAIKMKDSFINERDVVLRREDKKKTNAKWYTESLENITFVHKIGAETDVTNGKIGSSEYYDKVIDAENQDYIFLWKVQTVFFPTTAIAVRWYLSDQRLQPKTLFIS